jgi:predicted nucleic acid-binding protein
VSLHLLDSDTIIDHLRRRPPAQALLRGLYVRGEDLCISDVVLAEVYSGLHELDRSELENLTRNMLYLPTTPEAATQAGIWRYEYRRQGRQLSTQDCLIAATAYVHGAVLVAGNLRDFPMPELSVLPLEK